MREILEFDHFETMLVEAIHYLLRLCVVIWTEIVSELCLLWALIDPLNALNRGQRVSLFQQSG